MPKTYISDTVTVSHCYPLICLWELHNMTFSVHFLLNLNQSWSRVSLLSSCKSECTTPVLWNPATTFLSLSFLSTSALNFLSLSVPFFQPLPPSPFPTSARLLNPEWATFVSSKEAITDVTSRLAGCHFSTSPPPCISLLTWSPAQFVDTATSSSSAERLCGLMKAKCCRPVTSVQRCPLSTNIINAACLKREMPQVVPNPNCKLHSSQREYKFCCLILPLVQQPAEDWQQKQQRQQLRIPCKVGPRHFCARGTCWQLFILPKRRSGPGLCENAVPVLHEFAPRGFFEILLENENRIQSGGINIAAPPESNSWGNWKRGEGFRKYFTQTHPPTRKCPLRITNTSTAKVGLHELLIIPCYVTRKNDWREGGPWISYVLGQFCTK